MNCPLCTRRPAKRSCPALGHAICAVCCGSKRLKEISCPPDCGYLTTARQHLAAPVRKQQELDVAQLLPTITNLTERQHQLFFVLQTVIARHKPEGLADLLDQDVAEAAGSLAATFETAARGVIFEHRAPTPQARRLAEDLTTVLGTLRQQGSTAYDREIAMVLRAIELGAQQIGARGGGRTYLELMARLLDATTTRGPERARPQESKLVVP